MTTDLITEKRSEQVGDDVEVSNSSEFMNLKAAVTTPIENTSKPNSTVEEQKKAAQQTAMAGMPLSM